MLGVDLGIGVPPRQLLAGGDRLLELGGQLVEVHCPPRYGVRRWPVEHEVAAVLLVHLFDALAQLALEPLQPPLHALELVLEAEHVLDAGEVEARARSSAAGRAAAARRRARSRAGCCRPSASGARAPSARRCGASGGACRRGRRRRRSCSGAGRPSRRTAPPSGRRAMPSGAPRSPRAPSSSASSARATRSRATRSPLPALQARRAVAAQLQQLPVLRAGRDLEREPLAVRRRHLDGRAERGLGVGDRHVELEVGRAAAREQPRGLHARGHEQVAGGARAERRARPCP